MEGQKQKGRIKNTEHFHMKRLKKICVENKVSKSEEKCKMSLNLTTQQSSNQKADPLTIREHASQTSVLEYNYFILNQMPKSSRYLRN